ncbi:methyltransferase [Colletotrichum lupini]|uniref:Methyltransferase n=1 Tax=Colletotrichum lupini TaxID=145971 RepID=A0A9Q8SFJ9_9PEZI|nr:methyltransferase [Colletotrichum lupini]UQC76467.1 methyltransferase [Colletotrichum lupini]
MDDAPHAQQGIYFNPSLPPGMPVMAPIEEMTDNLEAEDASMISDDSASIDDQMYYSCVSVRLSLRQWLTLGSSTYTASLSAVTYPVEFGRRYHAYRHGAYYLPNDDDEMDRLDMTHNLTLKMLDDQLYLAPLVKQNVRKILDIGTGTGIWAMEMGDLFPNAEVRNPREDGMSPREGQELNTLHVHRVPPNVKFEIDDVESPWIGDRKYDFIFCRYMIGSIADYPRLIRNIYDNLNPGGWAEFTDMSGKYYSADGTLSEEHATHKWNNMLMDTIASMGGESRPGPQLEGWVRGAADFRNVVHRKYILPIGPWPKDPHYRELGLINLIQILEGLEGFSMRTFCGVLGWSKVQAEVMLAQVRNELKAVHMFHAQFDM